MLQRERRALDEKPARLSARKEFARARLAEGEFARRLKMVARQCVDIIRAFDPTDPLQLAFLKYSLNNYSAAIQPWARAVATRMLREVEARDRRAWWRISDQIGVNLKRQLSEAPLAPAMQQLTETQVALIGSIPIEAAEKVAEWTQKGLTEGTRPKEIADRIFGEIGGVTRARAMLIARTESSRAASVLQQARAEWCGVTHYTWTTAGDADVRKDHKALDGKVFAYSDPPVADRASGARYGPGQGFNCRCVGVPIISE
jgi:SPP1 gp7 family putative phage head morphogenesis protein